MSSTIPRTALTREQAETLQKVNNNMDAILRAFDEVLASHGIRRQVYNFSLVQQRAEPCQMCCCTNPPPSEACCDDCPKEIVVPTSPIGLGPTLGRLLRRLFGFGGSSRSPDGSAK